MLHNKILNAKQIIKEFYLNDPRPLCIAYSGGKDSTAVLYLVLATLNDLKENNNKLDKKIYVINSNTLAELPPLLKHLKNSLNMISIYANKNNLPIIVKEVFPRTIDTLNVQLLGVGIPPPSNSFRWCTDKLKVNPIDKEIKGLFPDGKFISVIGTRKDESFSRATRIEKLSVKGTNLKVNDRYPNASNLMPIEDWTTKDVWEYLLRQKNDLVNIDFLWQLYSDASGKDANECSFVGAGGKDIDDGKIGCGVSRFGCWQCYMVRDTDKSLDGLMKSGYENINLYQEYRDWYWNITQQGWEKTRDVYNHRTQVRNVYNKGGEENPKFGMTMPKGLKLKIRKNAFKKILELQSKLDEIIIKEDEIIEIQKRWVLEGDLELNAFKVARENKYNLNMYSLSGEMQKNIREAKFFYKENLNKKDIKKEFTVLTLKRFAFQYTINRDKVTNKFFPSKLEEKYIRKEWENNKVNTANKNYLTIFNLVSYNFEN
jgi:DNA sulfur modification protein DndC